MNMKSVLAIVLTAASLLLFPGVTQAATGATQPPPLHCKQPMPPSKHSRAQVERYNKALPKYRACIQAYVAARDKDAKKYAALSRANAEAGNAAVKQYNALVKRVSGK